MATVEQSIGLVDLGKGPQIAGTRITVMDIFYWIHRGYGWDMVHEMMPSLAKAEFDLADEYIRLHYEELAEKDAAVEERNRIAMEEQARKYPHINSNAGLPREERIAILKKKMPGR